MPLIGIGLFVINKKKLPLTQKQRMQGCPANSHPDCFIKTQKTKTMATIKIQRKHEFINLFRDYRLFVDGQKIGSISDGQEKEFNVTPGNHFLVAKIDWCSSRTISFELNDNNTKSFTLSGFKNKLMRDLFTYGAIILVIVFSLSSSLEYVFLIAPLFLILLYDMTLGRKKYLTLKENNDNLLNNEKIIATTI